MVSDRYLAYLRERLRGGAGLVMTEVAPVFTTLPRTSVGVARRDRPGLGAPVGHGPRRRRHRLRPALAPRRPRDGPGGPRRLAPARRRPPSCSRCSPARWPGARRGRDPRRSSRATARGAGGRRPAASTASRSTAATATCRASSCRPCRTTVPTATAERREPLPVPRRDRREIRSRCGRGSRGGAAELRRVRREAGLTPERSEEIVARLDDTGLFDFYDISGGNYHSIHRMIPTQQWGLDGHIAVNARARPEVGPGTPVFVAAAVRSIEPAAEIVGAGGQHRRDDPRAHRQSRHRRQGACRPRSRDPPLCRRQPGLPRRRYQHGNITCTVNPAAGRDGDWGPGRRRRPSGPARSW